MKVLVTGAAGFIGMHCALRLLERGDEVVGVDNLSDYYDVRLKEARLERLQPDPGFRFLKIDVSNSSDVKALFATERPQHVLHLAAQAGVRYSLVNPYYLTHKAQSVGYQPQVILAGRRINDGMAKFLAEKTLKLVADTGRPALGARVNVLGLTFKEGVADLRNSKVAELIAELAAGGAEVHVHDPVADPAEAKREYHITLERWEDLPQADALVVAVAHPAFRSLTAQAVASKLCAGGCVVDVKAFLDRSALERAGLRVWRL